MGCCKGNHNKKKRVTDDVTGVRKTVDDPDTARLNRTADLEAEETISVLEADTLTKTKKV